MKSVLISIKPKWCELIANGKKTIEVRKTKPKLETPFRCFIYCTKDKTPFMLPTYSNGDIEKSDIWKVANGKVIGEFVCNKINALDKRGINNNFDYCFESLNKWGNDDIEPFIRDIEMSCICKDELNEYGKDTHRLFSWHISDLKIYDEPRELSEFYIHCNTPCDTCGYSTCKDKDGTWYECKFGVNNTRPLERPPQSWCYVEELERKDKSND